MKKLENKLKKLLLKSENIRKIAKLMGSSMLPQRRDYKSIAKRMRNINEKTNQ